MNDVPEETPALRVRGLRKRYGRREVVVGVDLDAPRGAITAVLGPNGAGKTTTIECCEGLRTPDAGSVEVLGLPRWGRASGAEVARRGVAPAPAAVARTLRARVGVMLQDGGLPKAPSARAVLAHVAALHANPWDVGELMSRLDLDAVARTSVRRLSGGQAQRVALGCALMGRPDLHFLDEPSAGLDPHARRTVWQLVREIRDAGASMVLTTHLMDEAQALADLVHILHAGRVVASGSPAELIGPPRVVVHLPGDAHPEDALRARAALAELGVTVDVRDARTLLVAESAQVAEPGAHARVADEGGRLSAHLAGRLGAALDAAGLGRATLGLNRRTLEDVFLEITGEQLRADDASPPGTAAGERRGPATPAIEERHV